MPETSRSPPSDTFLPWLPAEGLWHKLNEYTKQSKRPPWHLVGNRMVQVAQVSARKFEEQ